MMPLVGSARKYIKSGAFMSWVSQPRIATLLFLILFLLPGANAGLNGLQDQPVPSTQSSSAPRSPDVLRATTRLVVVDVVATDRKGELVRDLKVEDFTLLEDGKPQKISGFSFQRGDAAREVEAGTRGGTFSNAPRFKNVNSMNVILLDALNGNFAGRAYGRDELIKFLDKGTLNQPTALYSLEEKLTLLHDFTTDTKGLKALVLDFKPRGSTHVQDVYSAASPFSARAPSSSTTAHTMELTIGALTSLARALGAYRGRKNLIWVSEGFPITLFPEIIYDDPTPMCSSCAAPIPPTVGQSTSFNLGLSKDFNAEVEKVANALMDAQVAVYPVDASGLQKDNHLNSIHTMRSLADRTGGKAFYNRNDLDTSIRAGIEDGSTYYTLEYYPANKSWDGKFRVIQIKGHPGLNLRYRQGYYALDPGMQNKDADKTLARNFSDALSLDSPSATGVVFQAAITPPATKQQRVTVNFSIDPHTLAFASKGNGVQFATVSCAVAAFSETGSLVKEEITNLTATMKTEDFEKMMKGQLFPCKRTIDLKPGSYNLALGVVDRTSRLMGTTTAWVKVP
jgi:VWFA-related protein